MDESELFCRIYWKFSIQRLVFLVFSILRIEHFQHLAFLTFSIQYFKYFQHLVFFMGWKWILLLSVKSLDLSLTNSLSINYIPNIQHLNFRISRELIQSCREMRIPLPSSNLRRSQSQRRRWARPWFSMRLTWRYATRAIATPSAGSTRWPRCSVSLSCD